MSLNTPANNSDRQAPKQNQTLNQAINKDIADVLNLYVHGTEHSDVSELDKAFHEHFRVVANTADGLRVINRDDYLALIDAKKIGGNKRELSVQNIMAGENGLQISLTLTGDTQVFYDHLELIKEDGQWKILHNSTQMKATN